jgi:(1->4)-alpha-D-glucan 1-alpha-D-glucosylmutase
MPSTRQTSLVDEIFETECRELRQSPPRRPGATYRLQLHSGFRLKDALAIVPYLDDLGVTDVYLSPYVDARPGSTHGYDVFDHSRINPDIGDKNIHTQFLAELQARGMGRVLDIVPNHMGVNGANRFWMDVLEIGPHSPFAAFFDIDWHPIKHELDGRVLLPILEDQYGKVLEAGKLLLEREAGSFFIRYHDTKLPLTPNSYAVILGQGSEELNQRFEKEDPYVLEYLSIAASAESLPNWMSERPEEIQHLIQERDVIRRRMARLCEECPSLRELIDQVVANFRGTPGNSASFDALHDLLEKQVYRLAYWRTAGQEINYRRFFDINDLAGLRAEDSRVFETIHDMVFGWIAEGGVSALRIDHPDGLADPLGYFRRLQESLFVVRCQKRLEAEGIDPADLAPFLDRLRARYRAATVDASSPLSRFFPIVVEKILSRGEELPDDWPVDGTVGYEYLNVLNGLFVDPSAAGAIAAIYAKFTGDRTPFKEVLYRAKRVIERASLASEIHALARELNRVSESDRRTRDFTLGDLRQAIREVIASFPVYRTYLRPGEPASVRDRQIIEKAVARARRRLPWLDKSVPDFLRCVLLNEFPETTTSETRSLRDVFVCRFQQTTGPIQAKGLEDTAFYRQVKLLSLNEVGADPWRFGNPPSVFHALNSQRLNRWPGSLGTTATHDTKRGEDARIRINVLSEIPQEWETHLVKWSQWNAPLRPLVRDAPVPDPREEYLLYEAILGAWPFGGPENEMPPGFVERIQQYMTKAVREAKINTSWADSDPSYVGALSIFVEAILTQPQSSPFRRDFLPFQRRIARVGIVHSLAQSLLKLTSPGIPDIFQGCELWDFSLVDPDNRRPVDYAERQTMASRFDQQLRDGMDRAELVRNLFARPDNGAIKQYVISTALRYRRDHSRLFAQGSYQPIEFEGEHQDRAVGFGRRGEGQAAITVVPRLVARMMGDEGLRPPLGREVWQDTRLILPEGVTIRTWRNLLTDRVHEVTTTNGRPTLFLGEIFAEVPLGLLVADHRE